jgi:TM2 domain-containing membrane protein YozV
MPPFRRQRAFLSQFTTSQLHLKNPWVVAFFSFSYPGFGHLLQHRYVAGFILIIWETFINGVANVNLGIFYSLLGDFDKAKDVLNERWLILYVSIYMFGIWDGYRTTVDLNKQYLLADREDAPVLPIKMGSWDMNYLDKRKPWVALVWSALFPGLGQLYLHNVISGFFIFVYTVGICYYGHILYAIHLTMLGHFVQAKEVLNMQWALYFPSIYLFIIYDAYVSAIENNKLFEKEVSKYLRQNYQDHQFEYPI